MIAVMCQLLCVAVSDVLWCCDDSLSLSLCFLLLCCVFCVWWCDDVMVWWWLMQPAERHAKTTRHFLLVSMNFRPKSTNLRPAYLISQQVFFFAGGWCSTCQSLKRHIFTIIYQIDWFIGWLIGWLTDGDWRQEQESKQQHRMRRSRLKYLLVTNF